MPAWIWKSGCASQARHFNWYASLLESAASPDCIIVGPGNRWTVGPERMVIASRKEMLSRGEAYAYRETERMAGPRELLKLEYLAASCTSGQ